MSFLFYHIVLISYCAEFDSQEIELDLSCLRATMIAAVCR